MKRWMNTAVWLILVCRCGAASPVFTNSAGEVICSLGTMSSSFWRTVPMPGKGQLSGSPVTFPGSSKHMAFLQETDFPYRFEKYGDSLDRPYLLHADEVVMVRFLGGLDGRREDVEDYDLAYRDDSGHVQLRRDLLRQRFAKYEESGAVDRYTIVLDNVPYCFPEDAGLGPFGQVQPPADLKEWHLFIVEVCKEIESLLGTERANALRFRLGTEMQGNRETGGHNRFDGSPERFFEFYKTTAQAVRSVLPEAAFGPWNIAAVDQGLNKHLIDYRELARFCLSENLPLDFIGHSLYFVPLFGEHSPLAGVDDGDWNRLTNSDPAEKVKYYTDFWKDLYAMDPRLRNVPLEIHEFGVLDNELGLRSSIMETQMSSRDAAEMLQAMFLLKKAGLSKCFHWGMSFPIPGTTRHLPSAHGWLLQVLDYTDGGDIWELPVRNLSRWTISRAQALGFFNCMNGKNYIIVSLFNPYRYIHMPETLEVQIPSQLMDFAGRRVRMTTLDVFNSPQRAMRDDLAAAGLLTENYRLHPDLPPMDQKGLIPTGVTDLPAAHQLLRDNEEKYVELCRASLTLEPFQGRIRQEDDGVVLSVETRASSVCVIEVDAIQP